MERTAAFLSGVVMAVVLLVALVLFAFSGRVRPQFVRTVDGQCIEVVAGGIWWRTWTRLVDPAACEGSKR